MMKPISRRVFLGGTSAALVTLFGCERRSPPAASVLPEAWQTDIDAFREQVLALDPSFTQAEAARGRAMLDRLADGSTSSTLASLHLALAEVAALAGNAHTALLNTNWQQRFPRVPLRFVFFGDRLFVGHGAGERAHLQGREVLAINGASPAELEAVWSRFQSGQAGWRREFVYHFLECPEMLTAAGHGDDSDALTLTLAGSNSETESVRVAASSQSLELNGVDALIPEPRLQMLYRLQGRPPPFSLARPDTTFRLEPLEQGRVGYLQFRANVDFSGTQDIDRSVEQTVGSLSDEPPEHLIVDQRLNFGGDLTKTRELMQRLPDLVNGELIVLTSGRTFSAGISSTGYLKQAGGDRVAIIGEPVGDALEFWAEGDVLGLPAIGANVMYSRERHNYWTGCPEDDCHGNVRQHPIRVESLAPDELVTWTYDDFVAARDPVLERAVARLSG